MPKHLSLGEKPIRFKKIGRLKDTLIKMKERLLPLYGERETAAIIRLIFHYLKGWDATGMVIHSGDELSPFVKDEIEEILKRLENHEPIQYITGEGRFHGLDLKVRPGVLIPRPETSELVDIIIDENEDKEDLVVWDIGTGSGAIAIALARGLKFPKILATDIFATALDTARENSDRLKTKITFLNEDIFGDEVGGKSPSTKFDIIVSNPPYIDESEKTGMERNVLDYEPHEALFVEDSDPLKYYKRIVEVANCRLDSGGNLYFEINPRHSIELKEMLTGQEFKDVEIIKDSFGKDRFIKGKKG